MGLFGLPWSRKSVIAKRRKVKKTSWLDKAAENASPLVDKMKDENTVLQAAIVQHITGISINPSDIHIKTPEEAMEERVMRSALMDIDKDPEFLDTAKEAMLERIRNGSASGRKKRRFNISDDEYGDDLRYGYMGSGNGYQDPLEVINTYRNMAEAFKGENKGGLSGVLESPMALELVKLLPQFFGKGGGNSAPQQQAQVAPSQQLCQIEVDGQWVEMTKQGFEVYKRQKAQLAAANSGALTVGTTPAQPIQPAPVATKPISPAVPPMAETPPESSIPTELVPAIVEICKRFEIGMKMPALDFATQLHKDCLTGDQDSIFIFNMMADVKDFDEVLAKLIPLKSRIELAPYIVLLEGNRTWAEAVISKIKELHATMQKNGHKEDDED